MRDLHRQQVSNMFIINCKNYDEISGEKINKLALIAEKISKKYKVIGFDRGKVKLSIKEAS